MTDRKLNKLRKLDFFKQKRLGSKIYKHISHYIHWKIIKKELS